MQNWISKQTDFLKKNTIYYSSPLGIIEIIETDGAIVSIGFINSLKGSKIDESTIKCLASSNEILLECVKQLEEYFNGSRKYFNLPLLQLGTNFQTAVWNELLKIPYGQTISYHTLSKKIGNAKAIRAVGTANGKNTIGIVIPCHRVIGSDGSLIGYAGDLWRKKRLLELEATYAHGLQFLF